MAVIKAALTDPTLPAATNSPFTEWDIRDIRTEGRLGISRRARARKWNCAITTIAKIDRGDTFAWVPDSPDMPSRMPVNARTEEFERARREYEASKQSEADRSQAKVLEMMRQRGLWK